MKLQTPSNGNASLLNLLIVILVGVLVYLLYTRGRLDQYLPEEHRYATRLAAKAAAESGEPGSPASATAAPASASTTAAPAAAAAASSAATAQTLATYSALPQEKWPPQVAIMRELEVPIVSNGRVAGSMKAKPGTLFELVSISGETVSIRTGEQVQTLPAAETDILFRFRQLGH